MAVVVSVNGVIAAPEESSIPVFDRGFLFGDSVYETLTAKDGMCADLEPGLDRLKAAAAAVGIDWRWSREQLIDAVTEVAGRTAGVATIRVTVSRGDGPAGLDPAQCRDARLVIIALPANSATSL